MNISDFEKCDLDGIEYDAVSKACHALAGGSTAALILALDRVDRVLRRPMAIYSDLAAVSADQDDYGREIAARRANPARRAGTVKEAAEARHAACELDALNEMVGPRLSPVSQLRRELCTALAQRGVTRDTTCLNSAHDLAVLIYSDRGFRRAWSMAPDQRQHNQPYWDQVLSELREAGVYV